MNNNRLPYARQEGHGARNRGEPLIVIANPRSAGGRTGASRDQLERLVARYFEHIEIWWTEAPGHATELARRARALSGHRLVAALGGDGTCHEVVNGLVQPGLSFDPNLIFTVIPSGTGGDLKKSLDIPSKMENALWIASTGMTLPLDVGQVEFQDGSQQRFINVAGFGANAEICRRVNQSSKRLGGPLTFLQAIFGTLGEYQPRSIGWKWTGKKGEGSCRMDTMAAFCGNGHYCGAGLWIGKKGSMADGFFELTILPPIAPVRALSLIPRAYTGTLPDVPGAVSIQASRVELQDPVSCELDGEPQSQVPVVISILPKMLSIRAGWLKPPAPGL
jgi:YegS/Rv2252/BmrU family lipid kinase